MCRNMIVVLLLSLWPLTSWQRLASDPPRTTSSVQLQHSKDRHFQCMLDYFWYLHSLPNSDLDYWIFQYMGGHRYHATRFFRKIPVSKNSNKYTSAFSRVVQSWSEPEDSRVWKSHPGCLHHLRQPSTVNIYRLVVLISSITDPLIHCETVVYRLAR